MLFGINTLLICEKQHVFDHKKQLITRLALVTLLSISIFATLHLHDFPRQHSVITSNYAFMVLQRRKNAPTTDGHQQDDGHAAATTRVQADASDKPPNPQTRV